MPVTMVQKYRDDRDVLHDSAAAASAANEGYDAENILESASGVSDTRKFVDWLSHVNVMTLDPLIKFLLKRRAEAQERMEKYG
jgi:hypothetical protein